MQVLINLSNDPKQRAWFKDNHRLLEAFLSSNRLDGIELIFHGNDGMNTIPQKKIKGIHLSYWPTWLDFWRGNQSELLKQFFNQENIELYYGGKTKQVLVSNYKEELKRAQRFSPSYMVFHVSHIQMEHVYSWNFTYSDWEVLEASAQLINQAFGSTDLGIDLLFENLWWPGLNFLDPELTAKFFQLIEYPRKGFMLDIGHLMLTRPQLKSEEEACHYILEKVEKLGELQHYIKEFISINP